MGVNSGRLGSFLTQLPLRTAEAAYSAMSGRQYNMYNTTAAEAWKQRVQKENMHNAPSLRQFADLNLDDDDARSVSSMASGRSAATGVTRDSRARIASTAALKRVSARREALCTHLSAAAMSAPPTLTRRPTLVVADLRHSLAGRGAHIGRRAHACDALPSPEQRLPGGPMLTAHVTCAD